MKTINASCLFNRGLHIFLSLMLIMFFSTGTVALANDNNDSPGFTLPKNPEQALEERHGGSIWGEDDSNNENESDDENESFTIFESESSAGVELERTYRGEHGEITTRVQAGATSKTSIDISEDGVELETEVKLGLSAELEAISERYAVGNEHVELSAQGQARLEALLGAEGAVKAHINEKGITLSAEGQAGAFVSASAEATFGAKILGIQTSVTVHAEAHAGALARGKANVTIGFDGRVKFELGAGVAFGVGASVGMSFDVDASELMEQLGLTTMAELLDWIDRFIQDPHAVLEELTEQMKEAAKEYAWDTAIWAADMVWDGTRWVARSAYEGVSYVGRGVYEGVSYVGRGAYDIGRGAYGYAYDWVWGQDVQDILNDIPESIPVETFTPFDSTGPGFSLTDPESPKEPDQGWDRVHEGWDRPSEGWDRVHEGWDRVY